MKFRSERDALVEMLATAGRAIGGRGGSSPVLLGSPPHLQREHPDRDRHRPRPDDSGHRRNHRDRGRKLCGSGTALDGHRAPARARSGDLLRRRRFLTISAARSTFKLHTYPVVEFPPVARTNEPTAHLAEGAFGQAIRQVVRAASHDDGRPLLTGVLVSRVDQSLRLVATDSYRMAMRDLAGTNVILGEEDLLVPARALSELQRLPRRRRRRRRRGTRSAWRRAATRSLSGRARCRSARACSRAAIRTTSN